MPTYFNDYGTLNSTEYNTDIKTYRDDLDIKLRNLYNNRDGAMKNQKQQIDSTVYENILLTVLATSILYFTFIKI
jgi:hypothetical protein